jgi:hypothetical protein
MEKHWQLDDIPVDATPKDECVIVLHQGRVDVLWSGSWSWPAPVQQRYVCKFRTIEAAQQWINQAGLRVRRLIDRRD